MEAKRSPYSRCCNVVDNAFEILSMLIIGLSTLAICIQVIGRSFGLTYAIFEEGPRLFFCYAVLPMLGVLYKRGRHINVEILPTYLKGKPKIILMLFTDVAMIVGSIFLLSAGVSGTEVLYASEMRVVGVLELYQYTLMMSVPIGAVILLYYSIEGLVVHSIALVKGKALEPAIRAEADQPAQLL
jgi:TRAP-type C4-dicarboxylate transport system permease small subunit